MERIPLKRGRISFNVRVFAKTMLVLVWAWSLAAQTSGAPPTIQSVRIVHDGGAPALEVMSRGGQIFPEIQLVQSPPRLVIDIANSRLGALQKKVAVHQDSILAIRADQFQAKPPITRIVLDLQAPYAFSWDAVGNRLMVRLKPASDPEVAKRVAPRQQVVADVSLGAVASVIPVVSGSGKIVAAAGLAPGSSLSAGTDTAVLQTRRDGEIRVCPHTTVSVTPARNKRDIMLGMSTGAIEAHESLDNSADSVITPDFRILFSGPGEFHFAISADAKGNTCVRALKSNTATATVSEVVGDRVYQVKPSEQAVFRAGQIDKVDANVPLECGCAAPPAMQQTEPATAVKIAKIPDKAPLGSGGQSAVNDPAGESVTDWTSTGPKTLSEKSAGETDPATPKTEDQQAELNVPLVFTAKNRAPGVPSAPLDETRALPVEDDSVQPVHLATIVEAPRPHRDTQAKAQRGGFFHRLKGLIQTIF